MRSSPLGASFCVTCRLAHGALIASSRGGEGLGERRARALPASGSKPGRRVVPRSLSPSPQSTVTPRASRACPHGSRLRPPYSALAYARARPVGRVRTVRLAERRVGRRRPQPLSWCVQPLSGLYRLLERPLMSLHPACSHRLGQEALLPAQPARHARPLLLRSPLCAVRRARQCVPHTYLRAAASLADPFVVRAAETAHLESPTKKTRFQDHALSLGALRVQLCSALSSA